MSRIFEELFIKQKILAGQLTENAIDEHIEVVTIENDNVSLMARTLLETGQLEQGEFDVLIFRCFEIVAKLAYLRTLSRVRKDFDYEDFRLGFDAFYCADNNQPD